MYGWLTNQYSRWREKCFVPKTLSFFKVPYNPAFLILKGQEPEKFSLRCSRIWMQASPEHNRPSNANRSKDFSCKLPEIPTKCRWAPFCLWQTSKHQFPMKVHDEVGTKWIRVTLLWRSLRENQGYSDKIALKWSEKTQFAKWWISVYPLRSS